MAIRIPWRVAVPLFLLHERLTDESKAANNFRSALAQGQFQGIENSITKALLRNVTRHDRFFPP